MLTIPLHGTTDREAAPTRTVSVAVTHHHHIIALAPGEHCLFENVLEVLDHRAARIPVAGVGVSEVGIAVGILDLGDEHRLVFGDVLVEGAAVITENRSGDELVGEQRHIGVLGLQECVIPFAVEELVASLAARDQVVAGATVQAIIERAADQSVIALLPVQLHYNQVGVGRRHGRIVVAQAAEIQGVVAAAAVHDQRVAFGPHAVANQHHVDAVVNDAEIPTAPVSSAGLTELPR